MRRKLGGQREAVPKSDIRSLRGTFRERVERHLKGHHVALGRLRGNKVCGPNVKALTMPATRTTCELRNKNAKARKRNPRGRSMHRWCRARGGSGQATCRHDFTTVWKRSASGALGLSIPRCKSYNEQRLFHSQTPFMFNTEVQSGLTPPEIKLSGVGEIFSRTRDG